MSVDVSSLAIKVHSTGIKTATKDLDKLALAAEKADKSTKNFQGSTTALLPAQKAATAQARQMVNAMQEKAESIDKASKSGGMFNGVLSNMVKAFIAYKAVNFAGSIIKDADAWTMMTARLKIATGSLENAKVAQQDLFDLAQKLRVPLADTVRLYTRMADPLRMLGKTSKETMGMVEGVGLALQLSGATGAEASSVMLQFSQSINAGRLNGAEFNAVAEGAPIILKALEIQTGKTRGELKKMGADGKISVEMLQSAIENQLPKWRKDFESLPITVDSALTRLKNAWQKAMGELGEDTGINSALANTIMEMENLIPVIRDELIKAFIAVGEFIKENKEGITQIWTQTTGLVSDVWNLVSALTGAATEGDAVGDSINGVGLALYAVRLLVAGLQDGFTFLSGIIAKLGAIIYKVLTFPMTLAAEGVTLLMNKVKDMLRLFSAGASALGLDSIAAGLKSASQSMASFTNDFAKRAAVASGAMDEMSEWGSKQIAIIANGQGAVAKLLDGEAAVTREVKKRGTYKEAENLAELGRLAKERAAREAAEAAAKKGAAAAKKAATEAKAASDAHLSVMQDLNNKYEEQLEIQQRLSQYGLQYDKLTEGEKRVIKLTQELNAAKTDTLRGYKAEELAMAQKLAGQEKMNNATKETLKLEAELKKNRAVLESDLVGRGAEFDAELAGAGMGEKARANQEKINAINKEFQDKKDALAAENAGTEGGIANFDAQLAQINEFQQKALAQYGTYYAARTAQEQNFALGASEALRNYQDNARDVSKQTEELFTKAFQGMEDALVEFAMTGKLNFKSLANSIIADIIRIQVRQSLGGGKDGGFLGSAFNFAKSFLPTSLPSYNTGGFTGDSWGGDLFANGASFTNGVVSQPTRFDQGTMGEAGPEAIMPLAKTSDGSLGVKVTSSDGPSDAGAAQKSGDTTIIVNVNGNNGPDLRRSTYQGAREALSIMEGSKAYV